MILKNPSLSRSWLRDEAVFNGGRSLLGLFSEFSQEFLGGSIGVEGRHFQFRVLRFDAAWLERGLFLRVDHGWDDGFYTVAQIRPDGQCVDLILQEVFMSVLLSGGRQERALAVGDLPLPLPLLRSNERLYLSHVLVRISQTADQASTEQQLVNGVVVYRVNTTLDSAVITLDAEDPVTFTSAGVQVGDLVSGVAIPDGATVISVDSATQVTLSVNAIATAAEVAVTFTASSPGLGWDGYLEEGDYQVRVSSGLALAGQDALSISTPWKALPGLSSADQSAVIEVPIGVELTGDPGDLVVEVAVLDNDPNHLEIVTIQYELFYRRERVGCYE